MRVNDADITRVLLADGWHVPDTGTVTIDHLYTGQDVISVVTWIEVRGNPADPEARIQVVAPFSEVLAFEVR